MMKRVTWFALGAAAGVGTSVVAKRKAKAAAQHYQPAKVAGRAVDAAKDKGRALADALREGRLAAWQKEAELRAQLREDLDRPVTAYSQATRPLDPRDLADRELELELDRARINRRGQIIIEADALVWRDRPSGPRRRGRR